jgi:osmoprotectant transport system permease protein
MRPPLHSVASPALWIAVLFVALLLGMPELGPVFERGFPGVSPPVFERSSFFALWLSQRVALAASGAATILGSRWRPS